MIDSTNPRIMANAIRKLFSKISAIPIVKGNPSGNGFNTLLTKLQIGTTKYKLPANVIANPEGEATDELTKIGIGSGIFSIGSTLPVYSTTEFETGKKWIDGRDVFGIVLHFESNLSIPNGTATWTATNVETEAETVISAIGIGETYGFPLAADIDTSKFVVMNFRSTSIAVSDIYIEYLKTPSE